MVRRPDIFLIGLGAQKSGTTWLARYLRHHPQVFMSPIKEMHFWSTKYYKGKEGPFDRRFARRLETMLERGGAGRRKTGTGGASAADLAERVGMGTDEAAYMEFFDKRAGREKVWAEITPSYSLVDRDGFAAMAKVSPETRFVFLMRNPVDRYWSQLRFSKRAQPELDVFAVFDQYMREPKFRLRTDYRRTLTEFLAAVPREKLFLEFFERLFTDATVQRFCDFLSVSNVPADFTPRGETAVKAAMTAEMRERAFRQFAHVYHYVDEFFAGDIPQSWRDDMVRYG